MSDPAEENPGTFSKEVEESPLMALRKIILFNINRIIIEDINIKSIRNKFEILSNVIENNIGVLILIVSQMKLGCYFPNV